MKFNVDGFKMICQCSQLDLKTYLSREMEKIYGKEKCSCTYDYIYCKGDIPILLLAHMDTVHKNLPEIFIHDEKQGFLCSPQGIGGDDRCGIYIILSLIKLFGDKKPHILFTTDEESGCVGAKSAAQKLKPQVIKDGNCIFKYLLEFDRRNRADCVFYNTTNKKFIEYVQSFGFKKADGFGSDIKYIEKEWDVAATNISCGYVYEHEKIEVVLINVILNTIEKAQKMINDIDNSDSFYVGDEKYVPKTYDKKNKNRDTYANYYGNYYDSEQKTTYGRVRSEYDIEDCYIQDGVLYILKSK